MKKKIIKDNKFQVFFLIFILLILLTSVFLKKEAPSRINLFAEGLVCPSPKPGQYSVQMVRCLLPTATPTPKSASSSGPPSECGGTIVSFGATKRLLAKGGGRPGTCFKPKWIVLHITAGNEKTAATLFNYFDGGAGGRKVASQFAVGESGDSLQMTESFTDKFETAYAVANYNNGSISIEITQPTVFSGKADAPPAQYAEVIKIVKALMKQYKIPVGPHGHTWKAASDSFSEQPPGVYGHYQFNPSTRTDPGAGFLRDVRTDVAAP